MKRSLLAYLLLLIVAIPPVGLPQTSIDPVSLFSSKTFHVVRSCDSINVSVREKLMTMTNDPRMADPGRPFIPGELVYDASLPRKRLLLAGSCDSYWFVVYQNGGHCLENRLILFRMIDGQPEPVLGGKFVDSVTNVTQLGQLYAQSRVTPLPLRKGEW